MARSIFSFHPKIAKAPRQKRLTIKGLGPTPGLKVPKIGALRVPRVKA